ncbi:phosphonate C-P lyase system protein PhnG [Cypionkella sp.]|uniref:phosphonate C-P lyase system protein PhnG n=1 Tax=Cypionkella sp. TaxID=2811411 RepID=UPI0027176E47|nr:phosphonate C-P lyase system protein PhnG [Cypionkella sp.]MDO8985940.1 phosphonate C-P lyase system protein PhnG [Cypionkella sp.]MDP2049923.1 phosphonate C-P lyase system protein PhnG [Cypionkella sp.]
MFDQADDPAHPFDHARLLDVLARADADRLATLAEEVLTGLGPVEVVQSRTGLVMLPMRDTVQGTDFHLGEVLVAEAHIRAAGTEGYGMVVGRDLNRAMAMAVVDAAASLGQTPEIRAFLLREASIQTATDTDRLREVEATRVDMETF